MTFGGTFGLDICCTDIASLDNRLPHLGKCKMMQKVWTCVICLDLPCASGPLVVHKERVICWYQTNIKVTAHWLAGFQKTIQLVIIGLLSLVRSWSLWARNSGSARCFFSCWIAVITEVHPVNFRHSTPPPVPAMEHPWWSSTGF